MTTLTLGNLLDRATIYEDDLERYYADLRDGCADNGVRLLTYYLRRRHQAQALSELGPPHLDAIRNVELQLVPEFDVPWMDDVPVMSGESISGDDVLGNAIGSSTHLVAYYRAIYRQVSQEEARELLETLIQLEERDIVMLNKMKHMHYL